MKLFIQQKNSVDASVILRVVGDLSVLAPDHFSSGCHKTQLTDVHLDDCTLRDNTLRRTMNINHENFDIDEYIKDNFVHITITRYDPA